MTIQTAGTELRATYTNWSAVAVGPVSTNSLSPEFLTMESLFVYCQTRMRDLDVQIKDIFAQQQATSHQLSKVNDLIQRLANGQNNGFKNAGSLAHETIREFWRTIEDVGGPQSPVGQKLAALFEGFITKIGKNGGNEIRAEMAMPDFMTKDFGPIGDSHGIVGCSAEDVKNFLTQAREIQGEISNGSELQMIKVQALMSQRQQAIQLVTGIIQSLGEQSNKIVANIGR